MKAVAAAVAQRGIPTEVKPYLERMSLSAPKTRQEWLWQRLLARELREIDIS
jgi:hypothetical protein